MTVGYADGFYALGQDGYSKNLLVSFGNFGYAWIMYAVDCREGGLCTAGDAAHREAAAGRGELGNGT